MGNVLFVLVLLVIALIALTVLIGVPYVVVKDLRESGLPPNGYLGCAVVMWVAVLWGIWLVWRILVDTNVL
jgi:hypothetical protein